MPTKPSIVPRWNTGGANRVTPPAGVETDGHDPNSSPSSSYENHVKFHTGEWCEWVSLGTTDPDEDAHIVETDAGGVCSLARLVVSPATGSGAALTVTAVGTGNAIQGTGSGAASGIVGTSGASGGSGVSGIGASGSNRPGVSGTGDGTGAGVVGTGGSGAAGVDGTGTVGVQGTPEGTNGVGVQGTSHASGTTLAAGVRGSGQGDASGVVASAAGDGYGCLASSGGERSALRLAPHTAVPATDEVGDLDFVDDGADDQSLMIRDDSGWKRAHASLNGWAQGMGVAAASDGNGAGTYETRVTCAIPGTRLPKDTGTVILEVTAEVGHSSAGESVDLQIYDVTAAAEVAQRDVLCPDGNGAATERCVQWKVTYTLPAAGARTFELRYRRAGAGGSAYIQHAFLEMRGVF